MVEQKKISRNFMTPFKSTNSYSYYDEKIKQQQIMIKSAIKILFFSILIYYFSDTEYERLRLLYGIAIGFFLNDFTRASKHYRELAKLVRR